MAQYWLRPWIYGCIVDGCLVLLDARADQYYLIEKLEWEILSTLLVQDEASDCNNNSTLTSLGTYDTLVQELLEKRLITDKRSEGKVFLPLKSVLPRTLFEQLEDDDEPNIKWHHVLAVFYAGLLAHIKLKVFSIERIINYIVSSTGLHCGQKDFINLARVYDRLRPVMIRNRICWYDSLSFFHFCRLYGYRPLIIFGVSVSPFYAHCWAQIDDIILNDFPANVADYQPIMII